MKKCTGENCPMQLGYDFENCAAIEKCPYRTWPVTIADRIRSMTDNELAGVLYNFRIDFITECRSGVSTIKAVTLGMGLAQIEYPKVLLGKDVLNGWPTMKIRG